MRLFVRHTTHYAFSEPQRRLIQLLRVTPGSFSGQQIVDWQINVGCDVRLKPGRDGFGNETTMLYCDGPIESLSLNIEGEVLTENRNGLVQGAVEQLDPIVYLRETPLTRTSAAIGDFAETIRTGEAGTIARLHRLMTELHARIRFDPDETHVHRDAESAFSEGVGVCQDHAHIFIATARAMGVPARYVSGHLFHRDRADALLPAAHAWAEAWVDDLGWVGFDPANAICPDECYIRVAIGLDYRDAAPVSGARIGGGTETLSVGVTVSQAQVQVQN